MSLHIDYAKRLIVSHPDLMMKDIERQVGFHNPFYFSCIFRETVQLSPSEYLGQYCIIQQERFSEKFLVIKRRESTGILDGFQGFTTNLWRETFAKRRR